MDETDLEKRLKAMEIPPPREEAKERTRQAAWFRVLGHRPSARKVLSAAISVLGIFLLIGFFGVVPYTVTQSTRSGGGDAQRETNKLGSAQITQYPASVRTSIIRMVIGNQDVDRLEFNPPDQFGQCWLDKDGMHSRCVFHPQGGGATYLTVPADLMAAGVGEGRWIFNGENEINEIGTSSNKPSSTAETAELIAFLPGVARSVCENINKELGIPLPVPVENGILFAPDSTMVDPDGTTPTAIRGGGGVIGGADAPALDRQPFGCFQQPEGNFVYYHVLIER